MLKLRHASEAVEEGRLSGYSTSETVVMIGMLFKKSLKVMLTVNETGTNHMKTSIGERIAGRDQSEICSPFFISGVEVPTMTDRYPEIDEAIAYIHQNLHDPITLSELANHVAYSPYHFTRIFKEKMGLPPLYYVSSLRLQKAKDLLLHTNLGIRDISLEIGQQSLGTFTTRFTERVGVTPSEFRNSQEQAGNHFDRLRNLKDWSLPLLDSKKHHIVKGTVRSEIPFQGVVLIGLFPKPIPEGLPLHGTLLSSLGDFCFTDVKPGVYYLMATSVAWKMKTTDFLLPNTTLRTRTRKPIIVGSTPVPHQQVTLYPPRLDDPPILISLPLLMNNFLDQLNQHSNREEIST
jgi:AraC-like DNA-binding protein